MQILYFLITLLIQINQIDVCPGVFILFPLYKKKSTQVLLVDITLPKPHHIKMSDWSLVTPSGQKCSTQF